MTIITEMNTKHPPSTYQQFVEASYSEDPSFSLKQLKESIRSSQQNGEEMTIGQIQEHWKMEDFFDAEKRLVERQLYYYISDEAFSFKAKRVVFCGCFLFGLICCQLAYNLYFDHEVPVIIRVAFIVILFCSQFVIRFSTVQSDDWPNPPYKENYNSISVSKLKQRQFELIDCYLNQVLPMKAEIPALRYRHDVLTMIFIGEWVFYAFFRACYSMYHLSNNWCDKEIRGINGIDGANSIAVFLSLSMWLIYWYFSKLATSPVKHTKQADCGAVHS
ncbi:hypothetical protein CRE_11253 [Caenorhabditis remanei]|uniref:Uncharacterized protein n=1 Tax=Caenorhabditis remanei TaxID=31234 RepID=E3MQ68_CAERE|nr:hypothetical protein CRE_11253 [Caenorhabditis remanei]